MAIRDYVALNIDRTKRVSRKIVTLTGKCPVCGEKSQAKVRFIANSKEVVIYALTFTCGKVKPEKCKGQVTVPGAIQMPS